VDVERLVRGAAIAGAALFVLPGAWAFADPASFYDAVALFPPYNRHLLHDVGAFQLGLGTALVLGLAGWNGLRVALWAVAVAAVLHAISHVVDRELGGRDTDPLALTLAAAVLAAAAVATDREVRRRDATAAPSAGARTHPPARAPDAAATDALFPRSERRPGGDVG
jgi:hypothetical protein